MIENYIWHNIALNVKFLYSVLFHWSIYTEITQLGRERGDTAMSNKASKPYIRLRLTPLINPNGPWWLNTHKKSHLTLLIVRVVDMGWERQKRIFIIDLITKFLSVYIGVSNDEFLTRSDQGQSRWKVVIG